MALDGDRDRRLEVPDPLHRCFAEQIPRARSISHQADYCLSPTFSTCPIFQDWASRAAAAPLAPKVPSTPPAAPGAGAAQASDVSDDGVDTRLRHIPTQVIDPADIDEVIATRPVPSYRAVPATGVTPTPADRSESPTSPTPSTPPSGTDDDVPVIRSVPTPRATPATSPFDEDDWMAPPPWLRQPTGPVWVAEAVPPPDALADVGTQGVRRPRPDAALPAVLAEAAVPDAGSVFGVPGHFGEETTGMPPGLPFDGPAMPSPRPVASSGTAPTTAPDTIVEATGTGTRPMDPGTSAELAASRYRADLLAGYEPDDESGTDASPGGGDGRRRVPIDVHASYALGSQARPTARSTGSREWEGPRRFEAYAATQRRRPPTSLLVGGSAIALAVLLLGVFLLPGMLMGSAPAATVTPAPTDLSAVVVATQVPSVATTAPDHTTRPEKTPKPKTYTVKPGDTLIKIAKRFKTSVAKIQCLNRIRNPNNVALGRRLTIPPKGYRCSSD